MSARGAQGRKEIQKEIQRKEQKQAAKQLAATSGRAGSGFSGWTSSGKRPSASQGQSAD